MTTDAAKKGRIAGMELAGRLRLVREERFEGGGIPALAREIGVPERTWINYERGVTIPGSVLLAFLRVTRTEPGWLLTGEGPRYRDR